VEAIRVLLLTKELHPAPELETIPEVEAPGSVLTLGRLGLDGVRPAP
jgi:hypothetical protein